MLSNTSNTLNSNLEEQLFKSAAVLVTGDEELIKDCFTFSIKAGITAVELREVILTSYLFDGYPTALEGFRILSEISSEEVIRNDEFIYNSANISKWRARGEPLCKVIYGPQFKPLMNRVAIIAPELADAMLVEGYGKVLSRDNLEPRLRELCVVTILAAKYKPRQLLSHALGALRLGANSEQLNKTIEAAEIYFNGDKINKVRQVILEAIKRLS
jgi:alkylhydroperoxidase/carboxymuconolactone decarboxylase family protein YurZ